MMLTPSTTIVAQRATRRQLAAKWKAAVLAPLFSVNVSTGQLDINWLLSQRGGDNATYANRVDQKPRRLKGMDVESHNRL